MKIVTKYSGEVEVSDERIIEFEAGIPAFEEEKTFVLLPFDEDTPFYVLQSATTKDIAFIVVNPFDFFPDYKVKIPDATVEQLEIDREEDVALFVILTVQDPFTDTTANLQGPIVINSKRRKGKQIVVSEGAYERKHPLFPKEVAAAKEDN